MTRFHLITALFCTLGMSSVASADAASVEGTWRGILGGKLHVVLTLGKSAGGYAGVLESVDQGVVLPVTKVELSGNKVHFEVAQITGNFDGTLSTAAAGDQLAGTWTQGGPGSPLALTRDKIARPMPKVSAPKFLDAPLEVVVPSPPTLFRSDGKLHLAYELHVTNLSPMALVLTRVEALADKVALGRYESVDLIGMVMRPGAGGATGLDRLKLAPGTRAVVFVWLTPEVAPSTLSHRITVQAEGIAEDLPLACATVSVRVEGPAITPPLRGGGWVAANGPSNVSGHRRSLIPIGGAAHIAQRFAIDWVKAGPDGKTFTGDAKLNQSYHAWGVEALAVGDGVVTAVKDGIAENIPGPASRAVPMTLETIGGNHVILDLGRGRYAFYAHLQPGSLKVKLGDKVRRGQVVGQVGNSGNSTEPHLHFHLSDGNSPLASEGIPYKLDYTDAGKRPGPREELPKENDRVSFPDAK